MGIPYYFSHVVKSHGQIIKKYQTLGCRANSLFLDSNFNYRWRIVWFFRYY